MFAISHRSSMLPSSWPSLGPAILMFITLHGLLQSRAQALTQSLCSSSNTGSGDSPTFNIYQSLGACSQTCNGFAFAIVQYQNCWCSDTAPEDTVDVSECDEGCPGFSEFCGSRAQSLFGYLALGPEPSGTVGSGGSTRSVRSTTQDEQTSTLVVETSVQTVVPAATSTTLVTASRSSATTTTGRSATTSTVVQSPMTSIVTVSGVIVTQTVAPTVTTTPDSLSQNQPQASRESGPSGGTIAGAVVGALAGVGLIALLAFLLWRRHRKSKEEEQQSNLNRNASVMSKAGLLAGSRATDPEKNYGSSPPMQQIESFQHAMDHPIPSAVYVTPPSHRRDSTPMVYDQRLNPEALMQNWESNGSRASVNTMHDQRDYSRPLKVSNPDIE